MTTSPVPPAPRFPEQLQERLITFAAAVCTSARRLPRDVATAPMIDQVVRSATSVAANYAEARAAQSRRDFVHKMQVCLKELRETRMWLELLRRTGAPPTIGALAAECDGLTGIFVTSINTARRGLRRTSTPN
ncbi:MAG: four helix bundle protein [Gemmatimonadota bacterium]|nr:four helix bundle protein [Gemmatimonadota bacterium]MDH5198030.1 four helix bundle protein [Gemmatimonadota bacterium]